MESKTKGTARGTGSSKKSSISGSVANGDDVAFQMTKALQTISKQQESFRKAVEQFQEIERDVEMRIQSVKKRMDDQGALRNKEMEELDGELERQRKRKRLDIEQDIREFGMEQVNRLLLDRSQVAVPLEELEQLKHEVQTLRQQKSEMTSLANTTAAEKYNNELKLRTETLQLRQQAELAAVNARADQQKNQIKLLEETIAALRHELEQQRVLTREIAYAQNSRPMIQQPAGNNNNNNNR